MDCLVFYMFMRCRLLSQERIEEGLCGGMHFYIWWVWSRFGGGSSISRDVVSGKNGNKRKYVGSGNNRYFNLLKFFIIWMEVSFYR